MSKKFNIENPVTAFISSTGTEAEQTAEDTATSKSSEEVKVMPKREPKTRRTQFLIRESTAEALKKYAEENNTSMNEVVNVALETFLNII